MAENGSKKADRLETEVGRIFRDMFGPYPQRPRRATRRKRRSIRIPARTSDPQRARRTQTNQLQFDFADEQEHMV